MVALACVQRLHDRGERLTFSVEVVAFADEEGLRFGTTLLASSAYAGTFDGELLGLENRELLGYCEVRIEQGPMLERAGLPVGVVTAINS